MIGLSRMRVVQDHWVSWPGGGIPSQSSLNLHQATWGVLRLDMMKLMKILMKILMNMKMVRRVMKMMKMMKI